MAKPKEQDTRQINPGVGSENDAKIKLRDEIANGADRVREADLVDNAEEPVAAAPEPEPEPVAEPVVEVEAAAEPEPVVETTPEPEPGEVEQKKFKLKVNGREREVSEEELIAIAQKVDSADQYLSAAKESFRTATQAEPSEPVQQPASDAPNEEQDFVAFARRLQMGSEEEAADALRQLVKPRPSVTPDDVGRLVEQRLNLRRELESLENEQGEILKHPKLAKVFRLRLSELSQQNPKMLLTAAYRQVGQEVREDFGDLLKTPTPVAAAAAEKAVVAAASTAKLERKASVAQVPSAATRQAKPPEEDVEETPSQTIAKLAKARHQEKATFHPGPFKQQ